MAQLTQLRPTLAQLQPGLPCLSLPHRTLAQVIPLQRSLIQLSLAHPYLARVALVQLTLPRPTLAQPSLPQPPAQVSVAQLTLVQPLPAPPTPAWPNLVQPAPPHPHLVQPMLAQLWHAWHAPRASQCPPSSRAHQIHLDPQQCRTAWPQARCQLGHRLPRSQPQSPAAMLPWPDGQELLRIDLQQGESDGRPRPGRHPVAAPRKHVQTLVRQLPPGAAHVPLPALRSPRRLQRTTPCDEERTCTSRLSCHQTCIAEIPIQLSFPHNPSPTQA